jgi:hypothetical protein
VVTLWPSRCFGRRAPVTFGLAVIKLKTDGDRFRFKAASRRVPLLQLPILPGGCSVPVPAILVTAIFQFLAVHLNG